MSELSERLPLPGASFLKPRPVRLDDLLSDHVTAAMTPPATMPDGWWVALLWAQDQLGVISCREVAPASGPPPIPPLERLGALMTNGLGDLLAVEAGRSCLKLRLVGEPPDLAEPWRRPLALQAAAKWDPLRVATMTGTKVAEAALDAFAHAIEIARRP